MTTIPAPAREPLSAPPSQSPRELATPEPNPVLWFLEPDIRRQLIPSFAFGFSAASVVAGTLALSVNSLDFMRLPLLLSMTIMLALLTLHARRESGKWERGYIALVGMAVVGTFVVTDWVTPEYVYGYGINGVIHRSLMTSLILLAVGLPGACNALYWVLGGTPTAWDTSRYPMLIYPIFIVLFIYAAFLAKVLMEGMPALFDWQFMETLSLKDIIPSLNWGLIFNSYGEELTATEIKQNVGLWNYILGTMLLVVMTCAIALPVGIGAGMCVSEHGGWLGTIVSFCTQMLRAISVFILGVLAFSIVDWSEGYAVGTWQSDLFRGYFHDAQGFKTAAGGSFLTAALVLSLLIIPVIARATEEGFRSIPREIREGSVAVGATEGHAVLFLLFPWAIPNIITGLVLGAAEAAGSVAVILFIAGTGENGVGPLNEVTSLAFLVFYSEKGPTPFPDAMGDYQFSAALLLLFMTFALSIFAVVLKQKFGARYRGLTDQ